MLTANSLGYINSRANRHSTDKRAASMSGWLKLSGLVVFTSYRHTHSTPLLLLLPPAPFILLGPDNHNDIKWHRSTMISHLKNNGMTLYWPDLVSHSDTAGCHWLTSKKNEHFFLLDNHSLMSPVLRHGYCWKGILEIFLVIFKKCLLQSRSLRGHYLLNKKEDVYLSSTSPNHNSLSSPLRLVLFRS